MKKLRGSVSALLVCIVFVASPASAAVREYWVQAEEALWDFAPSFPTNLMTGQPFTQAQRVFVEDFIGRTYLKAVYRGYADGTYSVATPREEHLGILGPILRGVVGDTIVVHFRNATRFSVSVHPHGVFYDKNSEGAPYEDGTVQKADDAVPPGGSHTYVWPVPRRAGPGPLDPSSVAWPYHSHTDETADTNAGLVGAIIITRLGMANPDATPRDVDREFVSLFTVFNENSSLYFDANVERAGIDLGAVDPDEFEESNLMHTINGLLWGNNTGYTMRVGERVRWYVISMGTEVDLHTPHWHGVTLVQNGSRLDVTEILPASSKTLDLEADNPGTWMYHCHVNDHLDAGMMTKFTILP